MLSRKVVLAGSIALFALAGAAAAAGLGDEREATMKDIGKSMKALAEIQKGATAFDAATVKPLGEKIAADLEKFKGLFPAGSETADNKASPDIWKDPAGFEAARSKAADAATALAAVTDAAAFKTAFTDLGGACKNCHTKYRLAD